MLGFRSEADVDRWCERRRIGRGAVMDLELIWRLSQAWYAGRADAAWRGQSTEQSHAIVRSVRLVGEFWTFADHK